MKIKWVDYSLKTVLGYFASTLSPIGFTVKSFDYFVDSGHDKGEGRVVFKLYCKEKDHSGRGV
jgi:hypothetical protein